MTYIETKLKREIVIDSIITIHYFEYMRDFVFRGESHDFWEFMYVDKGSVIVQGGEHQFTLHAGDIIFHEPNEFHAIRSVGNSSPNLVAVSFVSHSPAMGEFRGKKMTLNMEERERVRIGGVMEVLSFDEDGIMMETTCGLLLLKGAGMHIGKLDLEAGDVVVDGSIDSMTYSDGTLAEKHSILGRLFR